MVKELLLVSNIQRFSLHDGEGIRTTIFLKGCNLKCPWCANPENMRFSQIWFDESKCIGTKKGCVLNHNCSTEVARSIWRSNKTENIKCLLGALSPIAKNYSVNDLLSIVIKDIEYYENGGVTFSGGEPLLQMEKIYSLALELKKFDINISVETSLFVDTQLLDKAIDVFDYFIVDMKIMDCDVCKNIIGGDIDIYISNLYKLEKSAKPYSIRIPLIKEITTTEENLRLIESQLKMLSPSKIEVFSVHSLAEQKYKKLNMQFKHYDKMLPCEIEKICERFMQYAPEVRVLYI